ncbi:CotH kinase family protein [Teredinibacter purpureus]|uniref:CotH kinase family protein n=1 Tax=Teredinibacter purpureus TaxID=2731756 RepID=UPI000697F19A|nr:CotH kinase family protein [Teredinibacter purpureus]
MKKTRPTINAIKPEKVTMRKVLQRLCVVLFCSVLLGATLSGCSGGRSDGGTTNNGNTNNGGTDNTDGDDSSGDDDSPGGDDSSGDDGSTGDSPGDSSCTQNCVWINEAVSSNSTFDDEDGDSPDWFELYNYGTTTVSLAGWTISDDNDIPDKWEFPDVDIEAGGTLRLWASNKGTSSVGVYRTLVNEGDNFSYLVPTSQPSGDWNTLAFDDGNWQTGRSGFGYADGDDETTVAAGTRAVFVRKTFTLNTLTSLEELILDIDFDDAFVAYINGVEIARANILGDNPAWDASPIAEREATLYQSGQPVRYSVNALSSLVDVGENVLGIQLHNYSENSSDLTLIPFLSGRYNDDSTDGVAPPAILGLENTSLHTNFKISSSGETLVLSDPSGNAVDQLAVEGLSVGYSVGRSRSDGDIVYYQNMTPNAINSALEYDGIVSNTVQFSHQGGVNSPASVSLSGATGSEIIRYTIDGSVPSSSSSLYGSAIVVSSNRVIRARLFDGNLIPSRTTSRTFLPDANHQLPVIALATEPDNLFDTDTGIYVYGDSYEQAQPYYGANFWQDWEKDMHFSFYESDGSLGTALDAGVKIFGGWSRANDQRSLSIFARGRYGFKEIDYPLFPSRDYDTFQSVVLRNSGNDWMRSMIRDAALTSLMDGSGLETQAYRSVATYINGDYWGMYNLREKVNEHYLASLHDLDPDEIDILEREGAVVEGTNTDYLALVNFVDNNDLSAADNYAYVAEQIDIDNFIRYQVAQIYFNNQDWPGNNIKFWRAQDGGKWRWVLYDTDFGFGIWNVEDYFEDTLSFALQANGPSWPNPPWSTLLLRKLSDNSQFRAQFINQFADELNGRFKPSAVSAHIEAIASRVQAEMPAHFERWSDGNWSSWNGHITTMTTFGNNRPSHLLGHIRAQYGIAAMHTLTVSNSLPNGGSVQLNSLLVSGANWSGDYFDGIPVTLTAQPAEGHRFVRWQGASTSTEPSIDITLLSDRTIEPVFEAQ